MPWTNPARIPLTGAVLAIGLASPAMAAAEPSTRLVDCGAESCLQVSGTRESAKAAVHINGHAVTVQGGRRWQVRLPVATVRGWSEPYARTITLSVSGEAIEADLPIGLLGHVENLAFLTVRVR